MPEQLEIAATLIVSLLPFPLNLDDFNHRRMKADSERWEHFDGNTQMGIQQFYLIFPESYDHTKPGRIYYLSG